MSRYLIIYSFIATILFSSFYSLDKERDWLIMAKHAADSVVCVKYNIKEIS